jgi:hypothetical protein
LNARGCRVTVSFITPEHEIGFLELYCGLDAHEAFSAGLRHYCDGHNLHYGAKIYADRLHEELSIRRPCGELGMGWLRLYSDDIDGTERIYRLLIQ